MISENEESRYPLLIINADDFGWNRDRDRGILEAFRKGWISSATALLNGYNIE